MTNPIINSTDQLIQTQNGRRISIRLFKADKPKSVVIIAGATGVIQHCYEKFAAFLAANGHHAITFDYYGCGQSIETHVKHCDTDILEWGQQDCQAVIEFTKQNFPDLPLQWVGHSVGGHLLGMTPNIHDVSNVINMACGSGYWLENSLPTKRVVWFAWFVLVPTLVPLLGYFPGKKLNIVGDLPGRVMSQWRRWALHKDYAVGKEGPALREQYANVKLPITSISFVDDEMMSKKNIDSLHSFYTGANITKMHLSAEELGVKFVGHLGWFREKFKDTLWADKILPILDKPFN